MTREEKLIEEIELTLEIALVDVSLKTLIEKLLSNYKKSLKRFERVMKQSDKMSAVVASQNDMLEQLSTKLSKYLSPQIYNSIFSGEQEVSISSKRKKLTIFFSDIVNFTKTTENLESEELTELLNDYLTQMSNIALEFGATIDKYIGDAIVIFFGDPDSKGYKEDALLCVKMAMRMQEVMQNISAKYVNEGIVKEFQIRMGINTGYCTVGNFGSNDRMDYTIIGGTVNLAARLESAAQPSEILLSHETYSLIKDDINCIAKDLITVKGFAEPIQSYQVINSDLKQREVVEGEGYKLSLDSTLIQNNPTIIQQIEALIQNA